MSRQRHWLFWVNCVAEIVLVFILVFDKSQLANGFGPGHNGGARVSKKVKSCMTNVMFNVVERERDENVS